MRIGSGEASDGVLRKSQTCDTRMRGASLLSGPPHYPQHGFPQRNQRVHCAKAKSNVETKSSIRQFLRRRMTTKPAVLHEPFISASNCGRTPIIAARKKHACSTTTLHLHVASCGRALPSCRRKPRHRPPSTGMGGHTLTAWGPDTDASTAGEGSCKLQIV